VPTERFEIASPHPDIENGVARRALEYFVTLPSAGISPHTGLCFAICGYGHAPIQEYWQDKLGPYLADGHDVIVVTVTYFGCLGKAAINPRPFPDFFARLKDLYGLEVEVPAGTDIRRVLAETCRALADAGITELDPSCLLIDDSAGEYHSFGLLPALDHFQVMAEVCARYPVDTRRLFLVGTSYGGYIGLLMGKLAPATFRMIVDNSGFTGTTGSIYGYNDPSHAVRVNLLGVSVLVLEEGVWSPDPASPHFFAPHHAMVRDLLVAEHMQASQSRYFCYHAEGDTVAPTAEKIRFREMAAGLFAVDLELIGSGDLDGHLFKTMEHGMQASLRGLFDRSMEKYLASGAADNAAEATDFDLGTERVLACGEKTYRFAFSPAGITARLD